MRKRMGIRSSTKSKDHGGAELTNSAPILATNCSSADTLASIWRAQSLSYPGGLDCAKTVAEKRAIERQNHRNAGTS
jgi:hypothetical protein